MKSLADHWVKVNGYLIEVFRGENGQSQIQIDGRSVMDGVTWQKAIKICANSPSRAFCEPKFRYDERSPYERGR